MLWRFFKMLGPALRLLCPRCGIGKLYQKPFRMHANCPHCNLRFEREQGYYVGAIDINYASLFPIYDWLFGTHHLPEKEWPENYGVVGDTVPKGYWRQFVHPFLKPKPKEPAE